MDVFLGADLGGTHFRAGLRAAGAAELLDLEAIPASADWNADALARELDVLLAQIVRRHPGRDFRLLGLGVGMTGDPDPADGVCHSMTRFPRLEGVPLGEHLATRLGVPVYLLNDGLTAALAELRAGAGQGLGHFVMVTLGTGVGGGVVMDGRLVLGPRGRFGKVGHQILESHGPIHCHCGLPGCWQSLVGKDGVTARARLAAARNPQSALARLAGDGELDLREVIRLAEAGDPASRHVLEETGRYVGIGLANLVKAYASERAIVGGGIAEGGTLLLETAEATAHAYAVLPYQRVPVVRAAFGADAGVLGATFLAEGLA